MLQLRNKPDNHFQVSPVEIIWSCSEAHVEKIMESIIKSASHIMKLLIGELGIYNHFTMVGEKSEWCSSEEMG